MKLPKESDSARQPTLTINKEQMHKACRLMTAYYDRQHTIGQAAICMHDSDCIAPISAGLLDAEGWFEPGVWIGNRPDDCGAMADIIRAVWPPEKYPTDWTCTKLPDLAPFCLFLDRLEPEVGWSFMAEGPNLALVIPDLDDPRFPVLDMSDACAKAPSYTKKIAAAQVNLEGPLDVVIVATKAIERAHRFLPPLIELAGGRCKLLRS